MDLIMGLVITMILIAVCAIAAITLLVLNIRDLKLIIKMQHTELKIRETGIRHLQGELEKNYELHRK